MVSNYLRPLLFPRFFPFLGLLLRPRFGMLLSVWLLYMSEHKTRKIKKYLLPFMAAAHKEIF